MYRFYNAHETTAVEEFAIALLCGDVRCDVRQDGFPSRNLLTFHLDVCWSHHSRWK